MFFFFYEPTFSIANLKYIYSFRFLHLAPSSATHKENPRASGFVVLSPSARIQSSTHKKKMLQLILQEYKLWSFQAFILLMESCMIM